MPAAPAENDPFAEMRNDVRYHQARLALYRAKIMGSRPSSPARLRELEQACARAEERLHHALHRPAV